MMVMVDDTIKISLVSLQSSVMAQRSLCNIRNACHRIVRLRSLATEDVVTQIFIHLVFMIANSDVIR